jgi:hypothetical protein
MAVKHRCVQVRKGKTIYSFVNGICQNILTKAYLLKPLSKWPRHIQDYIFGKLFAIAQIDNRKKSKGEGILLLLL